MSGRTCGNCRWFLRYTSQEIGECRRYPPQHPQTQMLWPLVNQGASCGEWADRSVTAKEAERRELIRQFAVALVASGSEEMVHQVWQRAAEFADYEGQV